MDVDFATLRKLRDDDASGALSIEERPAASSSGKGIDDQSLAPKRETKSSARAARNAGPRTAVSSTSDGAAPTTTQPATEQNVNEALVNALAKANGGTCSNNCHCAIA